ncbi:hypothetical protein P3H15_55180, partial [Rhodococcus sp. T2V]|nr:hypothetical protein [Rhodococcus sp. T2V]
NSRSAELNVTGRFFCEGIDNSPDRQRGRGSLPPRARGVKRIVVVKLAPTPEQYVALTSTLELCNAGVQQHELQPFDGQIFGYPLGAR